MDPSRAERGVEAVTINLVEGLQRIEGLAIEVISCTASVKEYSSRNINGVKVHFLPSARRFGNITFGAVDRYRVRRVIDAVEPDIIHNQYHFAYPYLFSKPTVPAISTVHGITFKEAPYENDKLDRFRRLPRLWLERMVLRNVDHLLCVSEYVKETIAPLTNAKLFVVDNPVAKRYFDAANREVANRLLFTGAIIGRKNILDLLRAINLLRDRGPLTLHIVGVVEDRYYYDTLTKYVKTHRLESRVVFRGVLSDEQLVREYEECAVLVLSSLEESAGMVLQQAMAAGKPVIATRAGGIPCIVKHNVTGLLTTAHDVEELASAIQTLLQNSALRRRMGVAGREEALRRFQIDVTVEATLDAYRAVLGSEVAV